MLGGVTRCLTVVVAAPDPPAPGGSAPPTDRAGLGGAIAAVVPLWRLECGPADPRPADGRCGRPRRLLAGHRRQRVLAVVCQNSLRGLPGALERASRAARVARCCLMRSASGAQETMASADDLIVPFVGPDRVGRRHARDRPPCTRPDLLARPAWYSCSAFASAFCSPAGSPPAAYGTTGSTSLARSGPPCRARSSRATGCCSGRSFGWSVGLQDRRCRSMPVDPERARVAVWSPVHVDCGHQRPAAFAAS